MSVSFKTCVRIASAAGTGLALAAALPVLAQTATAPASVSATAGQMVTRDATTGELRMPTAEEARSLQAAKQTRAAATARTLPKVHATGAQGARLTDEFMSYTVMVRRADGTLVNQHFSSKEEAEAAVKSPAPAQKPATAPTE